MSVVIQMTEVEEAKALPILLRHSPGTILSNRMSVLSEEVVKSLRAAEISIRELSRESAAPSVEGVGAIERIGCRFNFTYPSRPDRMRMSAEI